MNRYEQYLAWLAQCPSRFPMPYAQWLATNKANS